MKLSAWTRQTVKKLRKADIVFITISFFILLGIFILFNRQTVYITARFKITDENFSTTRFPRDEYALSFVVGDKERNELGKVIAEIVNVESYKTSPEQLVTYLDIKFRAIYNPRKRVYTLLGKDIAVGEIYTFHFSNVKVRTVVVDFPGFTGYKDMSTATTVVQAQLREDNRQFSDVYGVPSYIANALVPGDTMKDSKGNILAKILEVQVLPAKRTIINSLGNSLQINDPNLKDVYYTLELSTKVAHNKIYMFDYLPVEIGARIPLFTKTVSVSPTIIKIIQ